MSMVQEQRTYSGPAMPPVTVCIMAYDGMLTANLWESLIRDVRAWPEMHIWSQQGDALISRTRSLAATRFLEQGASDVLVMLDADIGWEAGDLQHLVIACLETKSIVGGIYPMRAFGKGAPVRFLNEGEYQVGSGSVVECEYIGTGFMAIHKDVLREMAESLPMTIHGFYPFFATDLVMNEGKGALEYLSEDYAFENRARQLGIRVFADMKPMLSHQGTHRFRIVDSVTQLAATQPITIVSHGAGPVDVGHGLKMHLDSDDRFVSASLQRGQGWEEPVIDELLTLASSQTTFLDVGAHVGYVSLRCAGAFGHVVAYEPLPHLAELLAKNVEVNAVDVVVRGQAISDRVGQARIVRDYQNPGASFLNPEADGMGIECETVTLSDALFGISAPVVLKLDTEGMEYRILKEADLSNVVAMVVEFCDFQLQRCSSVTGLQFAQWLRAQGFRLRFAGTDREATDEALPVGNRYCNLVAERA